MQQTGELRALRDLRVEPIRSHIERISATRTSHQDIPRDDSFCKDWSSSSDACDSLHFGHWIKTVVRLELDHDEAWDGDLRRLFGLIESLAPQTFDTCRLCRARSRHSREGSYARYCHSECGWVPELKAVAKECEGMELSLRLADFPSRMSLTMFYQTHRGESV